MAQILQSTVTEKHLRTISILIVSGTKYTNKLKESLSLAYKNFFVNDFKLLVIKANYVADILSLKVPIDFIVFIVDTSITLNIEQVQKDLKLLDRSFFVGRICLVNATNFIQTVNKNILQTLSEEYKIPLINIDMRSENKCNIGGERILRLLHANLLKEIPFIPWSTERF